MDSSRSTSWMGGPYSSHLRLVRSGAAVPTHTPRHSDQAVTSGPLQVFPRIRQNTSMSRYLLEQSPIVMGVTRGFGPPVWSSPQSETRHPAWRRYMLVK